MPTTKDPRPEQERVTEAYENISKRLEALRKGEDDEESASPRKKSDSDDETATTASFETIEEEREELLVSDNSDSKDDEDDEIDPLDDEESDDEDENPESDEDDPLDEEEGEIPLQKKDDERNSSTNNLEREDVFDDVDELDSKLDELPKETLSERGEKLKEEEEEKSGDKGSEDKYQWKSFQKESDDEAPKRLDDLASEDDVHKNDLENDSDLDRGSDSMERPTNFAELKDADEMPIPKIHHGSNPSTVLGGEERRGGLNNRPSYHQDIRPSFGSDYGSRQDFNMNPKPKNSKWHLIILCLIGLAVIGGTVYLLKNQFGASSSSPSPSASAVAVSTPEPTPTPLPTVSPSEFKVRVLNGTSTTGLAADVMDKFKELGYQSDRTGNATNSAFTTTIVRVKEGSSSANLLEQVIKALSPDYTGQKGPSLKSNDTADVEVILGK